MASNMKLVNKDMANFQNKVWRKIRDAMNKKVIQYMPNEKQKMVMQLLDEQSKLFDAKYIVTSK